SIGDQHRISGLRIQLSDLAAVADDGAADRSGRPAYPPLDRASGRTGPWTTGFRHIRPAQTASPDASGAGDSASLRMFGTAAALALVWALAFPTAATASGEPVTYEAAVASGLGSDPTTPSDEGSASDAELPADTAALLDADPSWSARVNLYHAGGGGATGNDSLGCR